MTKADEKSTLSVSEVLADFALGLKLSDIPKDLVLKAKGHLLDGLGIALASSAFDFAAPILNAAKMLGHGDEAHAIASGVALPAAGAALVNGTLIHGLDFDDTHISAIYHATAPALAAALAAGEAAGASGEEVLTSFIVGLEIGCRLARAAEGGFHDRGFHPTALCGTFAAAFVAGRLLGADKASLVSAVGLCGSQAGGILETHGNWLKRMHPGWSAHAGYAAVAMGISGFKGPRTVLEGDHGFYHTHLGRIPAGALSPDFDLGKTWLLSGIALKPYPCCHFIHAFVDAALFLRPQVKIEDIASIDCPLTPRLHHMVYPPARPKTVYAAMFSVPYVVALALATGKVDLAAFHDMGISNPEVLALEERITCSEDKLSDFPVHFPGELRITLRDGTVLTRREATSTGTPERALSAAEIETKFIANATRVLDVPKAKEIIGVVNRIESISNISELLRSAVV